MKGQPLSDETKAKMKAGRDAWKARKAAQALVGPTDDAHTGAAEEAFASDPSAYDIFLSALDEETREKVGLAKLREIFQAQEAAAEAHRREQLRKKAVERAAEMTKANAGLLTPEEIAAAQLAKRNAEMVTIRVELPTDDDGRIPNEGIHLDGKIYSHDKEYTVTRAVAATLRDIMYRNINAELDFQGKGRLNRLRRMVFEERAR